MLKIEKMMKEIYKCHDMWRIKMIQAIDNETIIIIGDDVPLDIEEIIQKYEYEYEQERYTILNGETFGHYEVFSMLRKEIDEKLQDNKYDWNARRKLTDKFLEENTIVEIIVLTLIPYSLQKVYEDWIEEEKHYHYLTVKDLIARLQKTDQDAIVAIEDQEYGGYELMKYCEDPMYVRKVRECPDCTNGCCDHCEGREMFERKIISF